MPRELTRGQRAATEKARSRADQKKLTHRDLAEMVGVTEKSVWAFLNGQSWPRGRNLAGYEDALGLLSGDLSRIADEVDSEVQALHDAEPGERRLLELIQDLRGELDGKPVAQFSESVQRAVHRLAGQLAGLGAEPRVGDNVVLLKPRSVEEITGELDQELKFKHDILVSDTPGAREITEKFHDPKIVRLQAELELARRHGESSVTGS